MLMPPTQLADLITQLPHQKRLLIQEFIEQNFNATMIDEPLGKLDTTSKEFIDLLAFFQGSNAPQAASDSNRKRFTEEDLITVPANKVDWGNDDFGYEGDALIDSEAVYDEPYE